MTDRALFNRRYTSFTSAGTEVWLVNGAGVATSSASTQSFTAGETLVQGQVVYVSGTHVLSASAASGVDATRYNPIGITAEAAVISSGVLVNLDDIATIGAQNITAESSLVPGDYYYLSKYSGELTRYSTASGLVTLSGGYQALVGLGVALSSTELQVEIAQPIILVD